MNRFIEEIDEIKPDHVFILLQTTSPVEDVPTDFGELLELYYKKTSPVDRMLASVFNACYTQGKVVFSFTARGLEELIENDVNQIGPKFSVKHNYSKLVLILSSKLANVTRKPSSRNGLIAYELTFPSLSELIVSETNQTFEDLCMIQTSDFDEMITAKKG